MIETMLLAIILLLSVLMLMVGYIVIQIGRETLAEELKKERIARASVHISEKDAALEKAINEYKGGFK